MMEHGIHCLPGIYKNPIIYLLLYDVISACHSVKVKSITVGYSLVAMVTEIRCHLMTRGEHRIYCMLYSYQIMSELLPVI